MYNVSKCKNAHICIAEKKLNTEQENHFCSELDQWFSTFASQSPHIVQYNSHMSPNIRYFL